MKYILMTMMMVGFLSASGQATKPVTNGSDTLRAPISITNFIDKIETNAGLLIQRNDSLYQLVSAEVKANGEMIVRLSAYMTPKEAELICIESAKAAFNNKKKQ